MRRISIIGFGGSGKSVLARRLASILGIEAIHLDSHFWKAGPAEVSKAEQREIIERLIQRESWIIDGVYPDTLDVRFANSDTIIFLDTPVPICLWRIIKRQFEYRGRRRPDEAPGFETNLFDWRYFWRMLRWGVKYRLVVRPLIVRKVAQYHSGRTVVRLRRLSEIERFKEEVSSGEALSLGPSTLR